MAFDAFVEIVGGNVEGECTDSAHQGWVEVLSYSWGCSQPTSGSLSSGGSISAERADFHDFSIVKAIDNTSPQLYLACANGVHLETVTLELCRAGGDKQKYASFKMTDVLVSSTRVGGAAGGEALPTEEVTFRYGQMDWEYYKTDVTGGSAGGVNATHWNLKDNTGG